MSSRSRRGPLKAIKSFFDDYSDLGVIAAILAIGLFAALGYVVLRPGDESSTAKVELAASTTVSYPRFTVATTTTVDRSAPTTTTNSAPRPPGPTAATSPRARSAGKGTPRKSSGSPPVHHAVGPATSV